MCFCVLPPSYSNFAFDGVFLLKVFVFISSYGSSSTCRPAKLPPPPNWPPLPSRCHSRPAAAYAAAAPPTPPTPRSCQALERAARATRQPRPGSTVTWGNVTPYLKLRKLIVQVAGRWELVCYTFPTPRISKVYEKKCPRPSLFHPEAPWY